MTEKKSFALRMIADIMKALVKWAADAFRSTMAEMNELCRKRLENRADGLSPRRIPQTKKRFLTALWKAPHRFRADFLKINLEPKMGLYFACFPLSLRWPKPEQAYFL
ncbi:hypothetical protein [Rufibacter roseolus]|uniref:hypothetical protein n=1 Tax=Rufibacter roseolus TaxID=2817375 RepID=UPI001B303051